MRLTRFRRPAFTLVELLVVIGIIAVLISILLPTISKATEMVRTTQCAANLRSIGTAATAYSVANEGTILPYRVALPSGRYQWANLLADKHYIEAPRLPGKGAGAGALASGPYYCPSGNMDVGYADDDLAGSGSIPSSRTDARGAAPYRQYSAVTNTYLDLWYGMNADTGTSVATGRPGHEILDSSSVYLNMANLKRTSEMVFIYDGMIYHLSVNANRVNARHGGRKQTNILLMDGHVETWMTADLPGGAGVAKPADMTLANLNANYRNQPLKWFVEQP